MKAAGASLLGTLAAIFGTSVPKRAALLQRMVETSPFAPASASERRTLITFAKAHAGASLKSGQVSKLDARTLQLAERRTRGAVISRGRLDQILSPARARALFAELAAADIPHHFVDEGCHFRAHAIARHLDAAGVYCEKIFVRPTRGDLRVESRHSPIGFTLVMFHVATCVYVRLHGGVLHRLVLDPSLFDGPVEVSTWQARMRDISGASTETFYAPRFVLMPRDRDAAPKTWCRRDVEDTRAWNNLYAQVQREYLQDGFYAHLQEIMARAREQERR